MKLLLYLKIGSSISDFKNLTNLEFQNSSGLQSRTDATAASHSPAMVVPGRADGRGSTSSPARRDQSSQGKGLAPTGHRTRRRRG